MPLSAIRAILFIMLAHGGVPKYLTIWKRVALVFVPKKMMVTTIVFIIWFYIRGPVVVLNVFIITIFLFTSFNDLLTSRLYRVCRFDEKIFLHCYINVIICISTLRQICLSYLRLRRWRRDFRFGRTVPSINTKGSLIANAASRRPSTVRPHQIAAPCVCTV